MSHSAADEIDDDTLDPALRSESQELPLEERSQVEEASELPSDNVSEKKVSKKKTKKYVSKMRNAYKSWYLDEAYEFFDPYSQNQDLRKSRIHKDGICKYLQNEDPKPRSREELSGIDDGASDSDLDFSDEEERRSGGYLQNQGLGSLWTGKEKQVFFHNLSRHSIHTLDTWSSQIPGKSKYEILVYYQVLRKNLEELRRLQTKRHGGILEYGEFPIAYEMSETWITLEEELSNEVDEQVPLNQEDATNAEISDPVAVIDWNNWYKRWDKFYARHRLLEYYPTNRRPSVFTPESMQIMELLVKRYTSNLLRETIIPSLEKKCVPRELLMSQKTFKDARMKKLRSTCNITKTIQDDQDDDGSLEIQTSNHEFPHIVTENDVISALVRLRLYNKGKLFLTYPESIVDSVDKFQIEMERGKIFRNKNVLRHLKVLLYLQSSRIHSKQLTFSRTDEKIDWEGDLNSANSSNNSIDNADPSVSKKRKPLDPIFVDTPEYKKQKLQDESIDKDDELRSIKYTHTLLTWMNLSRDSIADPPELVHVTW
ncbi:Rrn5 [Kluyveromyces lactis]|nr:Rrn5 [Kluyveromyces lactis]